ncbi:MAG: hypothetical protein HYZ42_15250, partial [Bacteroidetes bacterium]|nr:hypothetical protein [Bacteroidota bacterium]
DNISLYLLSRFGPYHFHEFYASPIKILYSMLMSIPAQLGFKAVQITNAVLACLTTYMSIGIAKKMNLKEDWLVIIMIVFSPIYFLISLTVLSEILFSFVLVACISLIYQEKFFWSALLLSFLPYIRSEGYVLILVFITYFILANRWKYIPIVLVGTVFFCVTGYPYHHDILWVFTKNYGDASNIYGHGSITHFVESSRWINGPLLTVILPLALLMALISIKKLYTFNREFLILIMGCYFGFFVLHSFLWWKGLGASLGLIRVVACVMPLAGIIGVWALTEIKKYMFGLSVYFYIVIAVVHIYAGFKINKLPRELDGEHAITYQLFEESKPYLDKAPQLKFSSFYFGFLSGVDTYDPKNGNCWTIGPKSLDELKTGSVVQYETHFGPNECGMDTDYYDRERPDLKKVIELYPKERFKTLNGYDYKTVLYIKK